MQNFIIVPGILIVADPDKARVEVPRLYRHPKYGKTLRTTTVCYCHDENNESHVGDLVEIIESRPLSKTKRWNLVRIVRKSTEVHVETV